MILQTPELQVLHPAQTNEHWSSVLVCSCCLNVEPRRLRLKTLQKIEMCLSSERDQESYDLERAEQHTHFYAYTVHRFL